MAALLGAGLALGSAAASAAGGDPAAGHAAATTCQICHGQNGVSAAPAIPVLAGQSDQFLQWQLVFFRSGRRHNETMSALSQNLSDADIRNLGAFYAGLAAPADIQADNDPALTAKGQAVAEAHHCSACHTDSFQGAKAAPRVADQHETYLAKALADYRDGNRPSVGVAAMTEAASGLSDDDVKALAHYLATLR